MDAPPIPLTIVREDRIDLLHDRWWRRRPDRLIVVHRRRWVMMWLGPMPFVAIGVYQWLAAGQLFLLGFAAGFTTLLVTICVLLWQVKRQQRRALRRMLGDTAVHFAELDAKGLRVGTRGVSDGSYAWPLCALVMRKTILVLTVGGFEIPLNTQRFSAQELAQIRYWAGRHRQEPDVCPACRYDLTGSPGPTCPECGAAVRIADVTGLAAAKQ